ncbi:MAG: hypothetical protein AAB481_04565 [Patescibacteria group bacterium]|mgnify:CR=1 FL=1
MWNWFLTHSPLLYFTQSLWRDEAFSILVAQKPVSFILQYLTFEPPVYYILLHYWIKLFGTSEVAARSLSLLGFTLAAIVVILWSEKLFRKHWLSWVTPFLFITNPMLLYYAFEVRTYGWYIFFATLSLYAYSQARWRLFVLTNILGFYTHTYFLFLIVSETIHWLIVHRAKLTKPRVILREPMVASTMLVLSAMLPWIIRVIKAADTLKNSWYFPVDWHLVKSVLGNIFLGYEGTPWHLWGFTANFSLLLLVLFFLAIRPKTTRKRNAIFLSTVFVPLFLVIGVSFLKPLFTNRYVIMVAIAEVFLVAFAIEAIKTSWVQKSIAIAFCLFSITFNFWYPSEHAKVDIRSTMMQINTLKADHDVILAQSPLVFLETLYYSKNRSRVSLYNPYNIPFPWYVGGVVVSPDQMARDIPVYPIRAFFVSEQGDFTITYRTP